jgi:uncharacterized protein YgbK (DUF1537 family)
VLESDLLAGYPPEVDVRAAEVAASVAASGRTLVVLDDDPTGTQSVADLPVLTRWSAADFEWAFAQQAPAVYVLTNTRSLDPAEAGKRNREVVRNALAVADGRAIGFVSRSDSTLRGHFPLEPEVIADELAQVAGVRTDAVVIVPAFPEAGRVTIGGTHYMRDGAGGLVPVAETEFARDATFGFTSSRLAEYVQEKSGGRYAARDVLVLDLGVIRTGAVADALAAATGGVPVVADVVTENDLRALALGLGEAERRGKTLLYRVGPPFVRGRIGQEVHAPLSAEEAFAGRAPGAGGGLVVIGSHVGLTTRQLGVLRDEHPCARVVELRVQRLLEGAPVAAAELDAVVADVVAGLGEGDVVLHTSRELVRADSPDASLGIARTVSAALVEAVRRTLAQRPPRFVIAKGGITSSDVATDGLQIRHAIVRGPMLPGIVSLWEPVGGPATGIPYVVFAGNVGDDRSLLDVVRVLSPGGGGESSSGGRTSP